MATIPISAKASSPIHRRPRISRSSSALVEMSSSAPTVRSAIPGEDSRALVRAGLRAGCRRGWTTGRLRGSAIPGAGIATAAAAARAGEAGPEIRRGPRTGRRVPGAVRAADLAVAVAGGVMLDLLDLGRDLQASPRRAGAPRTRVD